ncbi:DUF6395 domain-containing protein [Demequina aurantiaca]|uniref:DUF6395 domain-containing protein n=1 Tax=Demequina aurantiaca TaxID=676200 RepID=UPI003D351135
MRVDCSQHSTNLTFKLEPSLGENASESGPKLARFEMTVEVPADFTLDTIHPDLLGLTALLVVQPWVAGTLELSHPVSQTFADAVSEQMGIAVSPISATQAVRVAPENSRPALAFSGGVDSVAVAAVMPDETIYYFNDRPELAGAKKSMYDKSAAIYACDGMEELGRTVRRVNCDVEHVRAPVGVPVDYSNAIPAVVYADIDGIGSVSWGTIAESAYRIGTRHYIDYSTRPIFTRWARVFEAAGLDFFNPLAGVSEVGTSEIVRHSPGGQLAQSCIRGVPGAPCARCWKCIRKTLLDSSLSGNWPTEAWVANSLAAPEPMRYLTNLPIKHECVLTYAMSNYQGEIPQLQLLSRRVRGDSMDVSWLKRYYGPALDAIPARYRDGVVDKLNEYLAPMSEADERSFEAWSVEIVETDPQFSALSNAFENSVKVAVLQAELEKCTKRGAAVENDLRRLREQPTTSWGRFKRSPVGRKIAGVKRKLGTRK